MRRVMVLGAIWACLACAGPAVGQEIVHALTGQVVSVNPKQGTITIKPDDGSEGLFLVKDMPANKIDFDQHVRAETVSAVSFQKTNTQVLLFYVGDADERTAVAIEDLGSGPLVKTVGTIEKYDRHNHSLTVKDASGAQKTFVVDGKTVVEGDMGVGEGEKSMPSKGTQVRVIAATGGAGQKALFIRGIGV